MSDPGSLLATLAQSSAAIVAIVGGFLVSRLVQLSSEREGLRRQLVHAQDELSHVTALYNDAHEHRFTNSQLKFLEWVTDQVVDADPTTLDRDLLLADNIPLGSSEEEMAPILDALIEEVATIKEEVKGYLKPTDDNSLKLEDLRDRGLTVRDAQESMYDKVLANVVKQLPSPRSRYGIRAISVPSLLSPVRIVDPATRATQMRRLDESIREEQELHSRKTILEGEVARVTAEIGRVGQPVGVTSAIVILTIYSIFGIVAPVIVMGFGPSTLAVWLESLLVGLFALGLAAVLAYIFWYAKTLDDPIGPESSTGP